MGTQTGTGGFPAIEDAASGGEVQERFRVERGERLLDLIYDEVDQKLNPTGEDCWFCSGEGETYDCIDGCCVDAEYGCAECASPCPECRVYAGQRAKAIREEVIRSNDLDIAVAWIKSVGRWQDDTTIEDVRQQMAAARDVIAQAEARGD